MAIAMYGYSWLKPAGCVKTMLGRREEEVEREEVERQLREVEMQERLAVEAEEQERLAALREQAEAGGEMTEGDRDLDDEIPEAPEGEEMDELEDDGMGGDLDDEIPEAEDDELQEEDLDGDDDDVNQEQWVYDTRREGESDEEGETGITDEMGQTRIRAEPARTRPRGISESEYYVDERDAEALANAMLDEDEMGEMGFEEDADGQGMGEGERDLDDDVPEADESWEHTDSELEDSEMDISILPPQTQLLHQAIAGSAAARRSLASARRSTIDTTSPRSAHQSITRRDHGARAVSGNAAGVYQQRLQRQIMMQTPGTASSDLDLESSAGSGTNGGAALGFDRRNWLDGAAGARRNLFGMSRQGDDSRGNNGAGHLFTPSPQQEQVTRATAVGTADQTPSEQLLVQSSGAQVRRSGRRRRDQRDSLD